MHASCFDSAPAGCTADFRVRSRCGALLGEGCPGSQWFHTLAEAVPRARPIFVNVGANKGYAIASFLELWATDRPVSARRWFRAINSFASKMNSGTLSNVACGVCHSCRSRHRGPNVSYASRPLVHALELVPTNRALLRHIVNASRVADLVRVHEPRGVAARP